MEDSGWGLGRDEHIGPYSHMKTSASWHSLSFGVQASQTAPMLLFQEDQLRGRQSYALALRLNEALPSFALTKTHMLRPNFSRQEGLMVGPCGRCFHDADRALLLQD